MTKRTSFLTRCLALVMALLLLATNANLGVTLRAFAAEGIEVTDGELVASNYALSEAEKDLLVSGELIGETHTYEAFAGEGLVTIDAENKQIKAADAGEWVAVSATIDGANGSETIAMSNGVGSYTYAGDAFTVTVKYAVLFDVSAETQNTLLNAAANLKAGVANLATAYEVDGSLTVVSEAMDVLGDLSNIGDSLGIALGAEAASAIAALQAQGDKLDLQEMNEAYIASASKIQYLVASGAAYKAELAETLGYLTTIQNDSLVQNPLVDTYLQGTDPSSYTLWATFKSNLGSLVNGLSAANSGNWTGATTKILKDGANYANVETLVAAVSSTTAVFVTSPLTAATATATANKSMLNVSIVVAVETLVDNEITVVNNEGAVAVAENAAKADVLAAIEAAGVEAKAIEGLEVAQYDRKVATDIPDVITENCQYVIAYNLKNYEVNFTYDASAQMVVPYGYQITLEQPEDGKTSYDYTINGEEYGESVYTVVGPTEISRTPGKAYKNTDLYTVIAANDGNDVADKILASGALPGNVTIKTREPDPTDTLLLTLNENGLTAPDYDASYNGLSWAPYSYGAAGTENKFGGENNVAWTGMDAKVYYRLNLTNLTSAANSAKALVVELKEQADLQTGALDRLAYGNDGKYYSDIGSLNRFYLSSLNGSIDGTDFTPDDGNYDDDATLAMREYFKSIVTAIIKNCLDGSNLKLYTMLTNYRSTSDEGGLAYYYANSEAIQNEIDVLSGYLKDLVGDQEKKDALAILLANLNYSEYIEKIENLGTVMEEVKEGLVDPNAALASLDTTTAAYSKLMDALEADGEAVFESTAAPYLTSVALTVKNSASVNVQIIVKVKGETVGTATTKTVVMGSAITTEDIKNVKADAIAIAKEALGEKYDFYGLGCAEDVKSEYASLTEDVNVVYHYDPVHFSVTVEGMDAQWITIENPQIVLPQHENAPSFVYKYSVPGAADIEDAGTYTLSIEQMKSIFNGVPAVTVTREESDANVSEFVGTFEDLNNNTTGNHYEVVRDESGAVVGLNVTINGTQNSIMSFAEDMINTGYNYIELNGEVLLGETEDANGNIMTEITLQSLINAIMADKEFGSERLIALGQNNGGLVLTTQMHIAKTVDDMPFDLTFSVTLNGVPAQMLTVANGLEAVKDFVTFQSNGTGVDVKLDLPDPVYEAYLTALLATSNLDKTDMNAIDNAIAVQFLYDYIQLIVENDKVTTTTFANTLNMLTGAANDMVDTSLREDNDLSKYEKYYQMLRTALNGERVEIDIREDSNIVDFMAYGTDITKLIDVLGINLGSYDYMLGMVKELKDGGSITAEVVATIEDTAKDYDALVIDVRADGTLNTKYNAVNKAETLIRKFDYTTDLVNKKLSGGAVIMLLDNIDGNLSFGADTVLDLNGKTINGNVSSNGGTLYIFDSSLATVSGAGVTGTVSGDVVVIGGTYGSDVSSYLKDGYYQDENGAVKNELYELVDGEIIVNTDYMYSDNVNGYLPAVHYMAADLALELALNYYSSAAVFAEGNTIYDINFDDLVGLLASDSTVADLVDQVLACVNMPELSNFINIVIDDLLDFDSIYNALLNDESLGDYTFSTQAWKLQVKHVAEGDYLTAGIVSNDEIGKTFSVGLTVTGSNKDKLLPLFKELSEIVVEADANVYLDQPVRKGKNLVVGGKADAILDVDLTVDDAYQTMMAVVLAYGNPDKAEDLIANVGHSNELKEIVDNMTVEEVFNALKALNVDGNSGVEDIIATMKSVGLNRDNLSVKEVAKALKDMGVNGIIDAGVDVAKALKSLSLDNYFDAMVAAVDPEGTLGDTTVAAAKEKYVHLVGVGVGKILEVLDITGNSSKMGSLDKDDDGYYELSADVDGTRDVFYRGYGLIANLGYTKATFKVKLFDESCDCSLWGDVNKDGFVDSDDAMLILQYYAEIIDESALHLCVANVYDDDDIDSDDAMLILKYYAEMVDSLPVSPEN